MQFFSLQVSLTDRCNLACQHCYREAPKQDAPLEVWGKVLTRFQTFAQQHGYTGIVSFSGGEPLLCHEIEVLIRLVRLLDMHARVATNGLLLDAARAQSLVRSGLEMIQISLDGANAKTHDAIRGEGAFEQALKGLRVAREAGLIVNLKATMLPGINLNQIRDFFLLANQERVPLVTFARLIPIGEGSQFPGLSPRQHLAWIEAVAKESMASPFSKADIHEPGCDRAFLPHPYQCGLAKNYLAIDSDGTVYPCRRMPIPIGNCFRDSFEQLWRHPLLESVRSKEFSGECGSCVLKGSCQGGCRAAAFAQKGDPLASDPSCWYAFREEFTKIAP